MRITKLRALVAGAFALMIGFAAIPHAQQLVGSPVNIVTQYTLVPISATAAVNAQTTLTIPAPPPGYYNYICTLRFSASNNATGTAAVNAVTTSTNFNAYAIKFSTLATTPTYDWVESWGIANVGCVKSTSPGTATTFVSPAAATNTAFTWSATYYQAQ